MTYKQFIDDILSTRGRFIDRQDGIYCERHHIVPRCMNGTDEESNLIDLYANEHYTAHKLLAQENSNNYKLVYAWSMMAFMKGKCQREPLEPNEYEELRCKLSEVNKGKPLPDETRRKISEALMGHAGHPCSDKQKAHLSEIHKGKKLSDETKRKLSEAHTGMKRSAESVEKTANANRGSKRSKETRDKMSKSKMRHTVSEDTRAKLSEANKFKRRPVCQFDLDGNFISEFRSIYEASKSIHCQHSKIKACCDGKI